MPDTIVQLDFSNKLEITINNERPVVLTDLTLSLLGVGHQFERFIENEMDEHDPVGAELFIKDVRSGSIIVELVAQAMPAIPLLWQAGSLTEWVDYAKSVVEWLSGKISTPPKILTKQDLKQWSNILEPVAKDNGSQMNFTVTEGGTVINQVFINSEQANAAQNGIRRQLEQLDEPHDHTQQKKVMVWGQTKFSEGAVIPPPSPQLSSAYTVSASACSCAR